MDKNEDEKLKKIISIEDFIYEIPKHLDVDTLKVNKQAQEKPVQWSPGMMEVSTNVDSYSRIQSIEKIVNHQ